MVIQIDRNQLLGVYKKETALHLQTIEHGLLEFEKGNRDPELVNEVFRAAHTIKGSSHLMGFSAVANLAHSIETALEGVKDQTITLKKEMIASIFEAFDALKKEVEVLKPEEERKRRAEFVNVDAERLDRLMDLTSELLIDKEKLSEDTRAFRSLRNLIRSTPLENLLIKLEDDYLATEMITEELKNEVLNLRLMPISTLFAPFPRLVRDLSLEQGKEIALVTSGETTQLDKKLIDGLKDPLMHIIRNSCDHGIELPEERAERGKPASGKISIRAYQKGGMVNIEVRDDGRGLDLAKIKQKAVQKNLVSAEKAEQLSPAEIKEFIFRPGFSTKEGVTEVSGRGVGMDVVKARVGELQGAVAVESEKGKGLTITIALPLTLILSYVQIIRVGGQKFALPLSFIKEQFEVRPPFPKEYKSEGETKAVYKLEDFLGLPSADSGQVALVLSSLGRTAVFVAEEVLGEQQIVVKPLGDYLKKINCLSGAAIMASGEVLLVLDVNDLIDLSLKGERSVPLKRGIAPFSKKRVLVVEDALVTRELERAILENAGFEVETAPCAEDALVMLQGAAYDLLLLDVQLPRMDGFKFCEILKADQKLKNLPVIMLSVLNREEDKNKGLLAGAAAYLSKQDFKQEDLLQTIRRVL